MAAMYIQAALSILIPLAVILCVTFFVLFALAKVEIKSLKILGNVVVILLLVLATLITGTGIYATINSFRTMNKIKAQSIEIPTVPVVPETIE